MATARVTIGKSGFFTDTNMDGSISFSSEPSVCPDSNSDQDAPWVQIGEI